ncbi:MAG TPA: (d)CMP kinase [Thermoanaerobaculia bacterium]|nr:(d)CMP kinase [Thermoanaerobaculia bacterium]
MTPPIVAIDGPSGAGKSTVARALAARLGVPYIDTGAMYRAVGLAVRDRGIPLPLADPGEVEAVAEGLDIDLELSDGEALVRLDGRDVSREIRLPEISLYASAVSAIPGVRRRLVTAQRRLAAARGGVLEGRDIGTKVFPDTPHKFFLTAPVEVRAERRARELASLGTPQPVELVRAEIEGRDRADSTRADSPLTQDDRYVVVDSGRRSVEEVVGELERRIRAQEPRPAPC